MTSPRRHGRDRFETANRTALHLIHSDLSRQRQSSEVPNLYSAWDELASRKLNPYWTSVMANRVLALRDGNDHETSSRWFEKVATSGAISPLLADRYHAEGFHANLELPQHVKVGEHFSAALRVTHASSGSTEYPGILFAGYYIDANPASVGRLDETQWIFKLSPAFLSNYRDCFPQQFAADHKGETRIRVVYWLVYQPSFNDQLKWQPDGSPAPITGAFWIKRFEDTRTIRVD